MVTIRCNVARSSVKERRFKFTRTRPLSDLNRIVADFFDFDVYGLELKYRYKEKVIATVSEIAEEMTEPINLDLYLTSANI